MIIGAGRLELTVNFIPATATLIGFVLFLSLGFWQLDRAEQKRVRHQTFLERGHMPPVSLDNLPLKSSNDSEYLWRPVELSGRFLQNRTVVLDNQVMNGVAGYYVYNTLKPDNSRHHVIVNRGWLPAGGNRSRIKGLNTPAEPVHISGMLKEFPRGGIVLKETGPERLNDQLYRVQKIDRETAEKIFSVTLLPYVARLRTESGYGYGLDWHDPGSGEETHLGYAFQWFAMACAVLIIFFILNAGERSGRNDT